MRDNGVSINLTSNSVTYGTPQESLPVIVTIDVAPQNDPPTLSPDVISVGPLGPDAANVVTAWEQFGGGVPTEDQSLNIDPAFLLANDVRGSTTAEDENIVGSANDLGLIVQSVTMLDPSQGTVFLSGGMITFTPAADIFGDVVFTYAARDMGINEDGNGMRRVAPLTSIDGTVTVSIQPVNDVPVAFDRSLTNYVESSDPGPGDPFVFTNADLIFGNSFEIDNVPGDFLAVLAGSIQRG